MRRLITITACLLAVTALRAQSSDQLLSDGWKAYAAGLYATADHFADRALEDKRTAEEAAYLKVSCMGRTMQTPTDSAKYVKALYALYEESAGSDRYRTMIVDYFARQGQTERLRAFAKSELQKDAKDKDAWALLGECDMMEEKWDDAIRDYEEAVKTDRQFVEALYNLALCHGKKSADKKLRSAEIKKATEYMRQVKQLDPKEERVKWQRADQLLSGGK